MGHYRLFLSMLSGLFAVLIIVTGGSCPSAMAEKTITLRAAWGFPQNHPFGIAHQIWAEKIEKDSHGRLKIEHYWAGSLINMRDSYNELILGVGDICEITGNYVKEGFQIEKTMSLLFYGLPANSEESYKIYFDLSKKYPEIPAEFSKVKALAYVSPPAQDLMTKNRAVRSASDIKGLTLKTTGYLTKVANLLGAQGAAVPLGETYMALLKGTIDGAFSSREALKSFRLAEAIKYYTRLNMPLWPSPHVAMNLDTYNKLPPDLQKVIDDNVDFYSKTEAEQFDLACKAGLVFAEAKNVEMIELPKDELDKIYNATEQVVLEEAKRLDAMGLPGTRIARDVITLKEKYLMK